MCRATTTVYEPMHTALPNLPFEPSAVEINLFVTKSTGVAQCAIYRTSVAAAEQASLNQLTAPLWHARQVLSNLGKWKRWLSEDTRTLTGMHLATNHDVQSLSDSPSETELLPSKVSSLSYWYKHANHATCVVDSSQPPERSDQQHALHAGLTFCTSACHPPTLQIHALHIYCSV